MSLPLRRAPGRADPARTVPAAALLACLLLSACSPVGGAGAAQDCTTLDAEEAVVLVSGTRNEPRPGLTVRALEALHTIADAPLEGGVDAKRGSAAVVVSADGHVDRRLPLTPRRRNCEVEHGFQRDRLIRHNVDDVAAAVSDVAATEPGLDLVRAIDDAVRGRPPGLLVVVSNALSTDGGFDLRRVGWNLPPGDLVRQLDDQRLLGGMLAGWRVLLIGVGETAGEQPPLTKPTRETLVAYVSAIVSGAGGTCDVDAARLPDDEPVATAAMPVIDVPGIVSAVGPDGRTTVTLSNALLEFAPDSARLSTRAEDTVRAVAARVATQPARRPEADVVVRGYVADPPGSTAEGRQRLSDERAAAVARSLSTALTDLGRPARIDAAGHGTPAGVSSIVNGSFDEPTAERMRIVTISY